MFSANTSGPADAAIADALEDLPQALETEEIADATTLPPGGQNSLIPQYSQVVGGSRLLYPKLFLNFGHRELGPFLKKAQDANPGRMGHRS